MNGKVTKIDNDDDDVEKNKVLLSCCRSSWSGLDSGAALGRRRRKISQLFTNLDWKYILQKCHLFLPGLYLCPPYSSPFPPQSFWSTQMHTLCCWWIQRKRIGWTEFLSSPKSVASRRPPLQKLCEMRLRVHNNIKAVSAKGSQGEGDGVGQRNTTRDVSYCSGDSVQQQQEEYEEDEVETHSEQYTIIISSHHLQQPARKSNPRKWNPTLLLAQLRPRDHGTVYPQRRRRRKLLLLLYEQWDEFNSLSAVVVRDSPSSSSSSLWTFFLYPLCRCWFPFVQWLNCIYFREKSWTSFSRFCDNSCWIVGSFFPFPHLSDLLDEYWVTPTNWQRWWWWWVATRTTTTIEQNELLKWNSSTHIQYRDTVSWDIPRVNTFLIINKYDDDGAIIICV